MAHFAKIGLNGKVIGILSLENSVLEDSNGTEHESIGINFLTNLTGWAEWRQTFKDGARKNFAGIGYTYDEDRDAFIPPKPFASWILNETTFGWEPPIEKPDGKHSWNEATQSWDPE